ncbi:hypothetical protein ACS0TY_032120 [Phlomoides rotata]
MPSRNFLLLSLLLATFISVHSGAPAEAPHPPPPHHHHHHNHPPPPPIGHPPPPPTHYPPPPPSHYPPPPPYHPRPATPPAHPPVKPPTLPPVKPPTLPPVKPPTYPPSRKKVAVQGVVYCKSCKYRGLDKVLGLGASPLPGAVVQLKCNNTKYGLVEQGKTDKNGYFLLKPEKLTTSAFHKCKVFLVSSPLARCTVPTNFRGGATGATLNLTPTNMTLPYQLFTVGPLAFEPLKKLPCHY